MYDIVIRPIQTGANEGIIMSAFSLKYSIIEAIMNVITLETRKLTKITVSRLPYFGCLRWGGGGGLWGGLGGMTA